MLGQGNLHRSPRKEQPACSADTVLLMVPTSSSATFGLSLCALTAVGVSETFLRCPLW